jgi:glycosyltransferase involved in cell wall biosynthesis
MSGQQRVVYHFGPSLRDVGGISSVIAKLVELRLGADVVRAVPTWRPGSKLRSGLLALRACSLVMRLPPTTVVHVHFSYGGSFVREAAVLACAQARGLPRIATIHGSRFLEFSVHRPRLVARVLRTASAITVLNEPSEAVVRALVPPARIELLPNPMPLDLAAGRVRDTAETVLFAGAVSRLKGADVLHRAWQIIAASRPSATCVMAGPAVDLDLPPLERFEVLGPVDRERVRHLIRGARVIALPSRAEALPMILSEAMAAGRPFVSTPVGGVGSLGEGGVLVPVGDHHALAAALIALLRDRDRAQALGDAGQALCRRWMTPDAVDARLRGLYEEVTGSATPL